MRLLKIGVILLALLLAGMAMVPMVSADTNAERGGNSTVITPTPTVNASDLTRFCGGNTCPMPVIVSTPKGKIAVRSVSAYQENDTTWYSDDIDEFVKGWNDKLLWGLTAQQIEEKSEKMNENLLSKYRNPKYPRYLTVPNRTQFSLEVGDVLGLTKDQSETFAQAVEAERQNRLLTNFESTSSSGMSKQLSKSALYVNPSTQSAPYAYGTAYAVYIITEFTTASPNPTNTGYWNTTEIEDALQRGDTGLNDIVYQSPSQSDMEHASVMYRTTIDGQNTGDNDAANEVSGWIETAAYNLGYRDNNLDGRQTDEFAQFIKTLFGADSVSLIFLTHDARGGWALGPSSGYADKAVVSYWEKSDTAPFNFYTSTAYEHEAVHLFGAMDEYTGGNSQCNGYSGLAVSPMSELYVNTNHETCSGSVNSVMRALSTSIISQSSKNFIGWGDHDSDGIIDPLDNTP